MVDLIQICNYGDETILIPPAGRFCAFPMAPGVHGLHAAHWEAIKGLIADMPDPLSQAYHAGTFGPIAEAKPKKAAKVEPEADTSPAIEVPVPRKKATSLATAAREAAKVIKAPAKRKAPAKKKAKGRGK